MFTGILHEMMMYDNNDNYPPLTHYKTTKF